MYAHVDINNFYVSCERLFRPELEGKVVVVLSNNDGCVIARSQEAKDLNIKMGDPEFMTREILKQHDATIFSSNYALYADMSARVMNNLARFTYMLMVYSIDECFMLLSNISGISLQAYAKQIRDTVFQNTGLPITVGVGRTASLAKLANKAAKKQKAHYLVLDTMEKVTEVVKGFEIEDVWGVGFAYYTKLVNAGVKTAADFRNLKPDWVRQHMTVQGLRLWRELWGEPCHAFDEEFERSKAICSSKSFNKYVTDLAPLEEAIATYTATVAYKLRAQQSMALNLTIFLRTNKHRIDHDQHYPCITLKLPFACNNTPELTKVALQGVRAIFSRGHYYLKGGVIASGIIPAGEVQYHMFTDYKGDRQNDLSRVMDRINTHYGKGTLRIAAEGYEKKWIMKQDYLSKAYTTNWSDVIHTR